MTPLYLDSGLGEAGPRRQLIPGHEVGIVGLLEGLFQHLQLLRLEGRSTSSKLRRLVI